MSRKKTWKQVLGQSLNRRAWDRMEIEEPLLASDLEAAVADGATPDDIYRFALRHGQSRQMAMWARNASAHLAEQESD